MQIVAADLSNIEGRGLAYIAGEQWKLRAFRDFDAGTGPDLYNVTATSIIGGDPWKVAKKDRNVFGKVPDLALGYEGGAGALQTFAKGYGVRMTDHWPVIRQNVAPEFLQKAVDNFDSWGAAKAHELEIDRTEWTASEAVKLAWRARHPATRALWYAAKDAAIAAIRAPGTTHEAGPHLKFGVRSHAGNRYLLCKLPSGRYLVYFDPRVTDDGAITYMGMGDENGGGAKTWCRLYTYGGKLIENATQAFARDVLAANMPAIERAGYLIVLTVHDEVITESTRGVGELAALLATVPPWAEGLPLAAAGFEADRYRKD